MQGDYTQGPAASLYQSPRISPKSGLEQVSVGPLGPSFTTTALSFTFLVI